MNSATITEADLVGLVVNSVVVVVVVLLAVAAAEK